MTLVSTSRKAAPGLRALARGLAFALGGRYLARGGTGMRDLVRMDPTIVLFSVGPGGPSFNLVVDEKPLATFRVTAHEERVREGPISRGLFASDGVRDLLRPALPAKRLDDGWDLGFDGPQRLQYRLRLARTAGGAGAG